MWRAGTASLLVVTALATGCQSYQLILWGVWGKPPNPLEYVELFGAIIVLLGAVLALASSKAGAAVAAFGCLMAWSFYGPALWNTIGLGSTGQFRVDLCAFFPPGLLAAASAWVVIVLCRRESRVANHGTRVGQDSAATKQPD
jgi:hypothetical protein